MNIFEIIYGGLLLFLLFRFAYSPDKYHNKILAQRYGIKTAFPNSKYNSGTTNDIFKSEILQQPVYVYYTVLRIPNFGQIRSF